MISVGVFTMLPVIVNIAKKDVLVHLIAGIIPRFEDPLSPSEIRNELPRPCEKKESNVIKVLLKWKRTS